MLMERPGPSGRKRFTEFDWDSDSDLDKVEAELREILLTKKRLNTGTRTAGLIKACANKGKMNNAPLRAGAGPQPFMDSVHGKRLYGERSKLKRSIPTLGFSDCWYWLNGSCLNPRCAFRHLSFAHGILATATRLPAAPPPATAAIYSTKKLSIPCVFFLKGKCKRGMSCPFMHSPSPPFAPPKPSKDQSKVTNRPNKPEANTTNLLKKKLLNEACSEKGKGCGACLSCCESGWGDSEQLAAGLRDWVKEEGEESCT